MRLFERLRGKLGYEPTAIDAAPKPSLNQAAAATPLVLESTEGMCCGQCSGKAEGHSTKKYAA
jgi:hypothetical protein